MKRERETERDWLVGLGLVLIIPNVKRERERYTYIRQPLLARAHQAARISFAIANLLLYNPSLPYPVSSCRSACLVSCLTAVRGSAP